MSRPRKSINVLEANNKNNRLTKEEIESRKKAEEKLQTIVVDKLKAPSFLSARAKREFNKVSKVLSQLKILSENDKAFLAMYANAYDNYIYATLEIETNGITVQKTNTKGYTNTEVNPAVAVQKSCIDTIMRCSSKLGLSVSDRLKIVAPINNEVPSEEENYFNNA